MAYIFLHILGNMTFVIKPHENKQGIHPFNKGQLFVYSRS